MGVTIKKCKQGGHYRINQLPAAVDEAYLEWTRLGDDEQYNVTLYRDGNRVEVVECWYDEDEQDWRDKVIDADSVDLIVFAP